MIWRSTPNARLTAGDGASPITRNNDRFVIQEHHARRLHYDFRLERDGVLVSWAVPKKPAGDRVGQSPGGAHSRTVSCSGAATFEGSIPKGEYGGREILSPLHNAESPFTARRSRSRCQAVTFVQPRLVGEVRYY